MKSFQTLFSFALLLMFFTSVVTGCVGMLQSPPVEPPKPTAFKNYEPTTFMLYYPPEREHMSSALANPIPDYNGWTPERMRRDIKGMQEAGIDVILTVVDMGNVSELKLSGYERFLEIASAADMGPQVPRIAFYLKDGQNAGEDVNVFLQWGLNLSNSVQNAWHKRGRQSVVFLGPELSADVDARHPAFHVVRTAAHAEAWSMEIETLQNISLNDGDLQAVVAPGLYEKKPKGTDSAKKGEWVMQRKQGKTLCYQLWEAVKLRPDFLVFRSWNNYANGTFIERNTLDGTRVKDALEEELKTYTAEP